MRTIQSTVLNALKGSQGFLDEHDARLTEVNQSAARQKLDAATASLAAYANTQVGSGAASLGQTAKQHELAADLRANHMRPIAAVARGILRDDANFASFRPPSESVGVIKLIALANGMADAAVPHEQKLIAEGLPATFLAEFRAAIVVLENMQAGRNGQVRVRVRSTQGLAEEERNGRKILGILDKLVRKKLGRYDPLWAEWKTARMIPKVRKSSAAAVAPAPAVPNTQQGGAATAA
jgi:hypothetical protein